MDVASSTLRHYLLVFVSGYRKKHHPCKGANIEFFSGTIECVSNKWPVPLETSDGLVGPLLSSNLCIVLCLVFLVSCMFHCFHARPAGWGRLSLSPTWGLFPLSAMCLMLSLIFLSPEIHLPVRHLFTWFFLVGVRIQWSSRAVEGCYTSARSG
jgi:hypothetical protein